MGRVTWLPWELAWQQALYGSDGFYRRSRGPGGHFATSAQGLGAAGTAAGGGLLAEAVLRLARRHRLTTIVDVGCGRGELLTAVALKDPSSDLSLLGVDVVPRPDGVPDRVGWLQAPGGATLPEALVGLRDALVVAHEWLDVVPCPVVVATPDGWRTAQVELATGRTRAAGPPDEADLAWLTRAGLDPATVASAEVGRPRDTAYADLLGRVDRGLLLAVDYGHVAGQRPGAGTLTGFRHGRQVSPVPDGSCDLTAHVAVDTLGADRLVRQREALHDLLGRPGLPDPAQAATDPASYLRQLADASALAALTAASGLGGFWWAMSSRGGLD